MRMYKFSICDYDASMRVIVPGSTCDGVPPCREVGVCDMIASGGCKDIFSACVNDQYNGRRTPFWLIVGAPIFKENKSERCEVRSESQRTDARGPK
jgi:hypothetical protein